ncbi:MAG: electron transport complex subunit RsxC [Oscillospiraceae bacterium]|nr:electron transport complex subunit RsxC [Oscillospiraceae bacterium]
MALTFRGGIHVSEHKNARKTPIEIFPAPKFVYIPLSQHIGAHAKPLVKAGDIVDKGQIIANNEAGLCCPVHSSVSGKVVSIEKRMLQTGVQTDFITIENDFENRFHVSVKPFGKKINETTSAEIIEIIKNAGISGMGGAMFPTYAKIQSALNKVTTLIVNCAECEPYITADHRLMIEHPEMIINGMKILLKTLGLKIGYIAIEDNKLNAADAITDAAAKSKMVEIKILKTKYPQGDERQIIYALTGKELPSGKLPADFGCIVFNAGTCAAVCDAFISGMPLIDRIVTVDGDCIITPKNLRVPIGTPVSEVIEYCGLKKEPQKIIKGGPMMGLAVFDLLNPVTKGTTAILAFSEKSAIKDSTECIRCGKCVAGCQMRLYPAYLAMFSQKEDLDMCEKYDVFNCVECGCCTYICPAGVPIVQHIRTAKGRILENRRREEAIKSAKQAEAPTAPDKYPGRSAAAKPESNIKDKDE